MEAALAQLRRLRSGAKSNNEPIVTILGPLLSADAPSPPDAMQLVFATRLPRLAPREHALVQHLQKSKSCACAQGSACADKGPWAELPFEVRGGAAGCPVLSSALTR